MATAHTNRLTAGAIQPVKNEPSASTALKPIEPGDLNEVMTFAHIAVKSNHFGLRNVEEAAFRILYGRELGMSVMQSVMGIDIIQGRPGLKAGTVASLIQRSGRYDYRVEEWTPTSCTLKFFDGGQFVGVSTFTIEDAKRAGVFKAGSNWDKYPKAMLFARAITQGARAYCPSIFFGPVYSSEELSDGVIDAEIVGPEVVAEQPPTVTQEKPKAAKVTKAAKAETVTQEAAQAAEADAPFDEQEDGESSAEKTRKLDEWAERVAKRFEEKGQASYGKPGAVIEEMYRRFLDLGFVQPSATNYRSRTQAIASMEVTWAEMLESLKTFASELAALLDQPPAEDAPEPGSDG